MRPEKNDGMLCAKLKDTLPRKAGYQFDKEYIFRPNLMLIVR